MQFLNTALHLLHALFTMHVGNSMRRVCYVANWAQYRQTPVKFTPENVGSLVDPGLCSHIVLAFLDIKDSVMVLREHNDEDMIDELVGLKARNPDLKVMVAIGGWNAGTAPFSKIIESRDNMNKFNKAAIAFLRHYELDGLDLDFEYPASRGSPPEDKERFIKWIKTLAREFEIESKKTNTTKLILSAAVGAGKKVIDSGYDVERLSPWVDFMNLMTYDFHGAWETTTGFNSPLRSADEKLPETNVEWAVNYWLEKGAPSNKLNIGIPAYGRSFRLCENATSTGVGARSCEPGPAGIFTSEPGVNAYFETCLKNQCEVDGARLYEMIYDEKAQAPYMYSKRTNDWISTETSESVTEKARLAFERRLGGVAVWTIDFDDWANFCGGGPQPLLRAINNALYVHHTEEPHVRDKRLHFPHDNYVPPCKGLLMTDEEK